MRDSTELLNGKQLHFHKSIITLSWNHSKQVQVPFSSIEIDVDHGIPVSKVCAISNEVLEFQSYNIPQSLLMQVIEQTELIHSTVSLMQMQNSPALLGTDPTH